MKQILQKLLIVTFLLALTQLLHARKIEVTDALSTAKNFIANTEYGKIRQKAIATNLELVYTESDANAPLLRVQHNWRRFCHYRCRRPRNRDTCIRRQGLIQSLNTARKHALVAWRIRPANKGSMLHAGRYRANTRR